MNNIHTIGCSFTNWLYPTWTDFIHQHYDASVNNLGYPGYGNDTIKKKLYTINSSKHVFVMFSGYDRNCIGIDDHWLKKNMHDGAAMTQIKKAILEKDAGYIFYKKEFPLTAFVIEKVVYGKKRANSKFHYYYKMLEYIFDCENYLKAKGIEYNFCMWQGFYNDLTELRALNQPKNSTKDFEKNTAYKKLLDSIDWTKFVENKTNDTVGPVKKGLWEHIMDRKIFVEVQSITDMHPSSLCHFYYFKKNIKPILDNKMPCKDNIDSLEHKAYELSKYYKQLSENFEEMVFDEKLKADLFEKFDGY